VSDDAHGATQARLWTQEIFVSPDRTDPRLSAVITEASLPYRLGMRDGRREPIAYLAEMSTAQYRDALQHFDRDRRSATTSW
jgi:hypothetical protein